MLCHLQTNHSFLRKSDFLTGMLLLSIVLLASASASTSSRLAVAHSSGEISYLAGVNVSVDPANNIGVNSLSVGFKLDHEWKRWRDSTTLRRLARDAGFRIINSYTVKSTSPDPCVYWNSSTKTGVFNWSNLDSLVRAMMDAGAEPMISIMLYDMASMYLPSGMPVNATTNLPVADQFAVFAAEYPKHFKAVGLPVKWYEINEEGFEYFGWNAANGLTKLQNYIDVWNAAARAMRAQDPTIKISDDSITMPKVFDYWLTHGDDVDFLSFHKYDSYSLTPGSSGYATDSQLIAMADTRCYQTSSNFYGIDDARQKWAAQRGKTLPVVNHETNLNSHWSTGTDPRIQTMVGAVWTALMLRMSAIKQLTYVLYYSFATSNTNHFGLINSTSNQPHYSYYIFDWFGNNLIVGDSLVKSTSSSTEVVSLAWIHQETLNLLLINKADNSKTIRLQGLVGQIAFVRIDASSFALQTGVFDASQLITMNGYTVELLQMALSQ